MAKRTIKKIAGRLVRRMLPKLAHNDAPKISVHDELEVYLVSSWNTRCGIAAYSSFLAGELKKNVKVRLINVTEKHAFSPYFFVLGYKTGKSNQIIQVQFAYGMFPGLYQTRRWGFSDFAALLFYLGLACGGSLVVTTFHEVKTRKNTFGRIKLVYEKLLDKLICSASDLIIVHTSESKEHLIKNYGVNSARIKIIHMGCLENPQFLNKDKAKAKLNLTGKTVITIPGFVSRNHGHDLAVSILPKLDKNVVLLIAGGTRTKENAPYYEELKEMAKKSLLRNRIVFVDDYPIPATILNATDIALLPYRYATESLSLRLLIAYRIPTITSDLNFFKEIKKQYDCTELFRTENKKDLLKKIQTLLFDQKKQKTLQEQCQKMWNENKWSSISKKYIETYLEVLSGHPDMIYDDKKQKERIGWLKNNVSGSALEIGCAGGFVTSYVNADVGLDINPWRIKVAKTKHPKKDFITASAFSLPFKNKAFDSILIPEILEHVPLPQAKTIIGESKRVAQLILTTLPNADKINYDKSIVENPEHMWFPTRKLALELLGDCRIQYTSEEDFILVACT